MYEAGSASRVGSAASEPQQQFTEEQKAQHLFQLIDGFSKHLSETSWVIIGF